MKPRLNQHTQLFLARAHARSSQQRAAMQSNKGKVRAECHHQNSRPKRSEKGRDKSGPLHERTAQAGTPASPRSSAEVSHEDDKPSPPQGSPANCDEFTNGDNGDTEPGDENSSEMIRAVLPPLKLQPGSMLHLEENENEKRRGIRSPHAATHSPLEHVHTALRFLYASLRFSRPSQACGTPCKACNGTPVTCGCLTAAADAVDASRVDASRIVMAEDLAVH